MREYLFHRKRKEMSIRPAGKTLLLVLSHVLSIFSSFCTSFFPPVLTFQRFFFSILLFSILLPHPCYFFWINFLSLLLLDLSVRLSSAFYATFFVIHSISFCRVQLWPGLHFSLPSNACPVLLLNYVKTLRVIFPFATASLSKVSAARTEN